MDEVARHLNAGAASAAERGLDEVLRIAPDHARANELLARILVSRGQWEQAAARIQRAITSEPANPRLYFALGSIKSHTPDTDGEIAAFRRAVELAPAAVECLVPLGYRLAERGQVADGEWYLRRALKIAPTSPVVVGALATVLTGCGQSGEAVDVLRHAAAANPGDWSLLGQLCQSLNYVTQEPGSEATALRRRLGELLRPVPAPKPGQVPHRPDPDRRLKIGYLSSDLRSHPVAAFLEPILRAHDRTAFEVFCYHTGEKVDGTTRRLMEHAATWRHTPYATEEELLATIRADLIDVLVELSGLTSGHRLRVLARRTAPIQATYIGCPSSTGLAAIDHRLVDEMTDPPGSESEAVERLERISGCFLCYQPPEGAPDPAAARQASATDRPLTFGSFNNLAKLSPGAVALWSGVLATVPGSRLLLKGNALREESVRSGIRTRFQGAGVDGERVDFLPETAAFHDHLACYGHVDVALDSMPYNGTTTTCEALWMGVPVVTLRGRLHAGRVGASLLTAAGCSEWVAETPEQFAATAAGLVSDRAKLDVLRAKLRGRVRTSRLCDATTHTREIEAAYRRMWHAWCATRTS